jgi:putative peptidoglycan lipid II flippase
LRLVLLLTAPAAALLVALASWLLPALAFGALARDGGPVLVAAALTGYGLGLTAYSWALFSSRVSYAAGDVRTPGLAALAGGVIGVATLGVAAQGGGTQLLYRVGLAHSVMVLVTAVVTLLALQRRGVLAVASAQLGAIALAAVVAGVVARVVADRIGLPETRLDGLVGLVAGGAAGLATYGVGVTLSGVRLRELRVALT